MFGDKVAEVVGAAFIAACLDHDIEPAGGEPVEHLQCLPDKGGIGIDAGGLDRGALGQAGLGEYPGNPAVVEVQLPGDVADTPAFEVVVAQDLWASCSGVVAGTVDWGEVGRTDASY